MWLLLLGLACGGASPVKNTVGHKRAEDGPALAAPGHAKDAWRPLFIEPVEASALPSHAQLARVTTEVAETWMATHPPKTMAWSWAEGVLMLGLVEVAEATTNPHLADYVLRYVEHHQARGDALKLHWNDQLTPATAATLLVRRCGARLRPIVDRVVDYLMWQAPRTASGGVRHLGEMSVIADLWIDSLFHMVPLLLQYGELTDDPRYLDMAAQQVLIFARALQDPATDLVTHAYDEATDRQIPPFAARAFWARGNGWMLASLVELLLVMPRSHPLRDEIFDRFDRLAEAIRITQSPSGLYPTLLLEPTSPPETAASGLITYAFVRGAFGGLLGQEALEAADRGMAGLMQVLVTPNDADGRLEVHGTSLATLPVSDYARVPVGRQAAHGVGAWLLAASAYLRTDSL